MYMYVFMMLLCSVCSTVNLVKCIFDKKKIKLVNQKVLNLIKKLNFEKDNELKKSSIDLKKHIEDWVIIWDKEKLIRNPKDNDVFIFTGYNKYPKDLELLLINRLNN